MKKIEVESLSNNEIYGLIRTATVELENREQRRDKPATSSVEDTAAGTIVHEGKLLRKVDREAEDGDFVRFSNQCNGNFLKDGIIYGPIKRMANGRLKVGYYDLYVDDHNRTKETVEVFEVVLQEINKPVAHASAPPTANQQRAELIQRAREFVEEHQRDLPGHNDCRNYGNNVCRSNYYDTEFFVKNNRVTAVIHLVNVSRKRLTLDKLVGRAACMSSDVFNEWIGKAIALAKALEIEIPKEFLDAVRPDEVVVGMKVRATGKDSIENNWGFGVVEKIEMRCKLRGYWVDNGSYAYLKEVVILDDTNAEYESVDE